MRIYMSHCIRGAKGKEATDAEMKANNLTAITAGRHWQDVLSKAFGKPIDFYIPGDHDEFVMLAYHLGHLTEAQILETDCKILATCDMLLVLNEDCISAGMAVEIDFALAHGIPVLYVKNCQPKLFNAAGLKVGDKVKVKVKPDGLLNTKFQQRVREADNTVVLIQHDNDSGWRTNLGYIFTREIIGKVG